MNTISPIEIRRLLESGQPLNVIDVRTPAEFSRLHARGARLLPLSDLTAAAATAQRTDGQPLYLICQSGSRAAKAWQQLDDAGVKSLYCIEGGTAAWESSGLPVERGQTKMISLERQVRIAAGSLVLLGLLLAWLVHPLFLILSAFVGAGLVFAGVTDYCGMALLLARAPWNTRTAATCNS
ncbi:MAG TPA: rhodanese-like domain-containing protein [Tepidisphaeraceae bacterium]|nr:rhodanese-like domain-containing protein [Tepidisphaeraceae bacterium]